MAYAILGHTADIRLKVLAKTKEELFCEAVKGMASIQLSSHKDAGIKTKETLLVSASDSDELLINFLNDLLALSDMYHAVITDCTVRFLCDTSLSAKLIFRAVSRFDHTIKAATYHDVHIRSTGRGYAVTILFDV